jgi:hemerythrin-like domain-containing protein
MIQIGAVAATIDTPIEHLMGCHRRIEQRLETLVNAGAVLLIDPPKALSAIRSSCDFLDTNGAMHTADEEDSLFPRLRPLLSTSEIAFVDSLEAEHLEADSIYGELKQIVAEMLREFRQDSAREFSIYAQRLRSLYLEHIRTEDEVLTALAKRFLGPAEIAEIAGEMRARRPNVIRPVERPGRRA